MSLSFFPPNSFRFNLFSLVPFAISYSQFIVTQSILSGIVCTSQFVVMFTGIDESGKTKSTCGAYISRSTRGLRSLLREHVSLRPQILSSSFWLSN